MFHIFETSTYINPDHTDSNIAAARKRRTTTVRACESCRRRKIRCNGEYPCETCQWYRKAASCHYTEPRQRQMPSRRSVEKISQTLRQHRVILQTLFPNIHPEELQGLSREQLVDLILKDGPIQPPSPVTTCPDDKALSDQSEAGSTKRQHVPNKEKLAASDGQHIKVEDLNSAVMPNNANTAQEEQCVEITSNSPQWSSVWQFKPHPFVAPRSGWQFHPMNSWSESTAYDVYYDSASTSEEQLQGTISGSSEYSELHVQPGGFAVPYNY